MSIVVLTMHAEFPPIHSVNAFREILRQVVGGPLFDGRQKALAEQAGCDEGLLSRILKGKRPPTPEFVGCLCGALPAEQAAELLQAYLYGVVETVASTTCKAEDPSQWTPGLRHVSTAIECHRRRKSA